MTAEEAVVQALARASQLGDNYPTTRSVLYRRLGVRQQQLYARAARLNAEYFTVCAVGTLDNGAVDLDLLVDPADEIEALVKVEIEDPGTSGYAVGKNVDIVTLQDPESGSAPRARVLDRVLKGYAAELDDVTSVELFYSRRPKALAPTDGAEDLILPAPHDELLVVNLASFAGRLTLDADKGQKDVFLAALMAEEKELLDDFDLHIQGFVQALVSRFGPAGRTPTA